MADTFTVGSDNRDGWYDDAAAAMVAVNADVRSQVAKRLANGIPDRYRTLFRESWWTQAVDRQAVPAFSDIAAASIDDLSDLLPLDLDDGQRVAAGAGAVGTVLGLLDQRYTTVRDRVKVLHAQARREDWDPDDLADALGISDDDDASGVLSDASADSIGRSLATLLIDGAAVFALNALNSDDVTATKTWRTAGDDRVRDAHADADGQTVGIDEPFDIGGHDAMFPGDPDLPADLAINCRCALEYSVDAGDVTLDLEEEEEAMAASAGPVASTPTTFAVDGARVTVTVEPTAAEKTALAVYADVPAELHVPLLDVGDVASFTPDARTALAGALSTVAANTPPLSGQIAGTGYLDTDGVTVGLVDCPGLGDLRAQIADALYDLAPEPGEFIPTLVLTAGSVDVSTVAAIPVHFNELRVHVGGAETLVFDLLGPIPTAPSPDTAEPDTEAPPPEPADPTPPADTSPEASPMTTSTSARLTFATGGNLSVPAGWRLVPETSATAGVTFAPVDTPGMAPGDTAPPDGGDTTAPPAPALADCTDEEIESEIARRAATQAAADLGGNPDDLMADALEEVSGIVAEIVAELETEDPAPDAEQLPPAPTAVAAAGDHETLADGDSILAPDVNADGIGETPSLATDYEWEGILAIEGIPTSDGRMFAEGALTWRTLPLTLALQTVTAPGHDGAVVCGSICEIARDGNNIIGRGRFSATEAGELARTLIGEGSLHGVSIDVASAIVVYTDENGDDLDPVDVAFGEPATAVFVQAEMMAATLTPFPAFADARVDLIDAGATSLVATGAGGCWRLSGPAFFTLLDGELATDTLVASAAPAVVAPPEQLFALRPNTTEPFQVLAPRPDGTIPCYGLVADWKIPHIGMGGRRVYPPRGDDFAHLYTGKTVLTREGTRVPTCPIFIDTVHPDLAANASDAQAWYAHTGAAVADVHLYEGEHGIVAAGVLRPGVDELATYRLRGSDVSPDWRWVDGKHRMVALLAVNASGFPVPMVEGIAASAGRMRPWVAYNEATGEPLAMVAVGAIHREPSARQVLAGLQATVSAQGAQLAALTAQLSALRTPPPVEAVPVEPVVDDGPVELSADERAERARAALATMGLDRESRARRARAALGLVSR